MHRSLAVPFCAALATSAAFAQQQYPEGAPIPRSLTALERAWLAAHPLAGTDAPTPPPTGPVHCAAEYEPCDGLVIAWEGSSSWTAILAQIAYHVTTTGNANIYCYVDSTSATLTVTRQQALPASGFLMLLGDQQAATPFDGGTMLVLANSGFFAATDAAGQWQLAVAMPDDPVLCGATLFAQAWMPFDPLAAGAGWAASNGLALVLGH